MYPRGRGRLPGITLRGAPSASYRCTVSVLSIASRFYGKVASAGSLLSEMVAAWGGSASKSAANLQAPEKALAELPSWLRAAMDASAPLLQSRDLGDLEGRLAEVLSSLRHVSWSELLTEKPERRSQSTLPAIPTDLQAQLAELQKHFHTAMSDESSEATHVLGLSQSRALWKALMLGVWIVVKGFLLSYLEYKLAVERGKQEEDDFSKMDAIMEFMAVSPWSLHEGESIPLAAAESAIVRWEGFAALLAVLTALFRGHKVEPWLSWTLLRKVEDAVNDTAKFFASNGYPPTPEFANVARIDWVQRWQDAEAQYDDLDAKLVEAIQAGRVGIPDDDDD